MGIEAKAKEKDQREEDKDLFYIHGARRIE